MKGGVPPRIVECHATESDPHVYLLLENSKTDPVTVSDIGAFCFTPDGRMVVRTEPEFGIMGLLARFDAATGYPVVRFRVRRSQANA
jgi:hypothetical protein